MEVILINIKEDQPNIEPFLFLNDSLIVNEMASAECILDLNYSQWFFQCHWPDLPNMPASLQLEAMTQVGGMLIFKGDCIRTKHVYVRSVEKSSFFRMVTPGLSLKVMVNALSYKAGILVQGLDCRLCE